MGVRREPGRTVSQQMDGTLVVAADLPAPMRSWYEIWEGRPTLWVRRDLLADLTNIAEAHLMATLAAGGT